MSDKHPLLRGPNHMIKADIVERLLDFDNEGVSSSDRFHLRSEAAAEIERLRKENHTLRKALTDKARAALEPKP